MKCVGDNLKTDTILQKTVLGHFEYSKKIPQKLKNEEDWSSWIFERLGSWSNSFIFTSLSRYFHINRLLITGQVRSRSSWTVQLWYIFETNCTGVIWEGFTGEVKLESLNWSRFIMKKVFPGTKSYWWFSQNNAKLYTSTYTIFSKPLLFINSLILVKVKYFSF